MVLTFLALLCVLGLGCSRNNLDYGPTFASAEARGELVYERNCSGRHNTENLPLLKQPLKLNGLFRQKALPSGAPATDEQVRNTIVGGRGIMPPFERTLDGQKIDDLVGYLHTL